jgi:hypothetical protein
MVTKHRNRGIKRIKTSVKSHKFIVNYLQSLTSRLFNEEDLYYDVYH